MNKQKRALILILTIIILAITLLTLDGVFFANKRVKVIQYNIESPKIDNELNNTKIVYFSDAHYNLFVDNDRFSRIITQITDQKPDVVLFGGDLFENNLSQQQMSFLIDQLNRIEAPLGKFYVRGEAETLSDYANTTSQSILRLGEFEQLNTQHFKIFKQQQYFNLIGIDENATSTDVNNSLNQIDNDQFTLLFSHKPNKIKDLNLSKVDMMVSGFTHGGQINIPLFNGVFFDEQEYNSSTQTIENTTLYISSGVGTTKIDIRMFADGDILVFTLKSAK